MGLAGSWNWLDHEAGWIIERPGLSNEWTPAGGERLVWAGASCDRNGLLPLQWFAAGWTVWQHGAASRPPYRLESAMNGGNGFINTYLAP
jgi:hypothetical protein